MWSQLRARAAQVTQVIATAGSDLADRVQTVPAPFKKNSAKTSRLPSPDDSALRVRKEAEEKRKKTLQVSTIWSKERLTQRTNHVHQSISHTHSAGSTPKQAARATWQQLHEPGGKAGEALDARGLLPTP